MILLWNVATIVLVKPCEAFCLQVCFVISYTSLQYTNLVDIFLEK